MNPSIILCACAVFLIAYVLSIVNFGASNEVFIYAPSLLLLVGLGGVIWGLMARA